MLPFGNISIAVPEKHDFYRRRLSRPTTCPALAAGVVEWVAPPRSHPAPHASHTQPAGRRVGCESDRHQQRPMIPHYIVGEDRLIVRESERERYG